MFIEMRLLRLLSPVGAACVEMLLQTLRKTPKLTPMGAVPNRTYRAWW